MQQEPKVWFRVTYEAGMGDSSRTFTTEQQARAFIADHRLKGGCTLARVEELRV